MSADAPPNAALAALGSSNRRRAALRLGFGVTACFAVVHSLGLDATFVAPLLAAQMLVKLDHPPSLKQGIGILLLIALSTATVLIVTTAFIRYPAVLVLTLALLNYLAFYAHRRGAPDLPTLLLQISAAALPVLAVVSPDSAAGFAATLLSAGVVALMTVWAAHATFPAAAAAVSDASNLAITPADPLPALRDALLDTAVLLPVLTWFILDASEVAVVVLIVIVTLLRQRNATQGQRAALGLIVGNAIGGIAAVSVYNLAQLNDTLAFFVAICLAVSLMFAGRIVSSGSLAPIYAIAFATFILLLGLGLTPLPGGSGDAFIGRIVNVLLASAYAIGALSLVEPWRLATARFDIANPPVP